MITKWIAIRLRAEKNHTQITGQCRDRRTRFISKGISTIPWAALPPVMAMVGLLGMMFWMKSQGSFFLEHLLPAAIIILCLLVCQMMDVSSEHQKEKGQ